MMNYVIETLSSNFLDLILSVRLSVLKIISNSNECECLHSLWSKVNDLHRDDKKQWVLGYDIARYHPGIYQLAFCEEVIQSVTRFGIKRPVFTASKIPLRCDMPFDENFDFPWHQDFGYNMGSENSVMVWIPLQDTFEENGALEIIEGDYLSRPRQDRLLSYSPKGTIIQEEVDKLLSNGNNRHSIVPIHAGQILIFNQMLVHRSGKNVSSIPRLSLQVRFSDLDDPFFIDKGYLFSKNDDLPSYADVINYLE